MHGTAYALLAKLYLNAAVYTGASRYDDCVAACDTILQSGKYKLTTEYAKMFYPDNGPQMTEFIFAIPYDHAAAQGEQYTWYSLHPALQAKYGLAYRLSNPVSTIRSYYAYFDARMMCERRCGWLAGSMILPVILLPSLPPK